MGLDTSCERRALRWAGLCNDASLHDLPFKVELNAYGVLETSPASTRHGRLQFAIGRQLDLHLPGGTVMTECPVATGEGVRCPDVAWASPEFVARHGDATPLPQAPDICVEVLLPSNTEAEMEMKLRAYLGAGAVEVWLVAVDGGRQVHDAAGPRADSRYGVTLHLR